MNDKRSSTGDHVFDVVQIGYGPVGQVNALLLGQLGHDVAVVERHPTYPFTGSSRDRVVA